MNIILQYIIFQAKFFTLNLLCFTVTVNYVFIDKGSQRKWGFSRHALRQGVIHTLCIVSIRHSVAHFYLEILTVHCNLIYIALLHIHAFVAKPCGVRKIRTRKFGMSIEILTYSRKSRKILQNIVHVKLLTLKKNALQNLHLA